jgi:hypothetical protein
MRDWSGAIASYERPGWGGQKHQRMAKSLASFCQ